MLETIPVLFSKSYWKYAFSWKVFLRSLFSAFGVLWTAVKCTSFFFVPVATFLQTRWYLFLGVGVAWAIWACRPTRTVTYRLTGRDVSVQLLVGDLFAATDAIIVGSNSTFATDPDLISSESVQGQFTKRYYDSAVHLDADIRKALQGMPTVASTIGKANANREYAIGTVAKVRPKNRVAFLVAIATINPHGNAQGSIEDLRVALAALWQFIAERGGEVCPLRMPVLGTGFSRITETRQEIVKEIIRSFVAACAERRFCEKVTIVISPKDFMTHEIDFGELSDFTRLMCRYAIVRKASDGGLGTRL